MAAIDVEKITELIRTETDPAALQAKLVAMIEEAHPAAPFKDGEIMPLYEFERRFKKYFCGNVEPVYQQRQVKVVIDPVEGLMLSLTPLLVFETKEDGIFTTKDTKAETEQAGSGDETLR